MKLSINEKAKTVTIEMPLSLGISKTGKSTTLCSTHGFVRTDTQYDGKPVSVQIVVMVPVDKQEAAKG